MAADDIEQQSNDGLVEKLIIFFCRSHVPTNFSDDKSLLGFACRFHLDLLIPDDIERFIS